MELSPLFLLLLILGVLAPSYGVRIDAEDDDVIDGEDFGEDDGELGQLDPVTGRRTYSGFQVIRTLPRTDEDIRVLRFLEKGKISSMALSIRYTITSEIYRLRRLFNSMIYFTLYHDTRR